MTHPNSKSWISQVLTAFGILSALVLAGIIAIAVALVSGSSRSLPPNEITDSVARLLMDWEVLGPIPDGGIHYTNRVNSLAKRMTGKRGYTEGSFPGDGTDWYEVELSAGLAEELKLGLSQSTSVTKRDFFLRRSAAPTWWPTNWPPDAQFYEKDMHFLVLTDGGRRAWFLRVTM